MTCFQFSAVIYDVISNVMGSYPATVAFSVLAVKWSLSSQSKEWMKYCFTYVNVFRTNLNMFQYKITFRVGASSSNLITLPFKVVTSVKVLYSRITIFLQLALSFVFRTSLGGYLQLIFITWVWHGNISFFKWANLGLFFVYFWSFQTNNTIFTTNQCEKCHVHPVSGAGIRTQHLWNVSLLP